MQTSIAKKIFAVGVAASTVLMSLAPFAAQAAAHVNGTNIKTSDGTVSMIIEGQRRPYTSAGAFLSYGFNSWSQVVDANADDLALPVGSFIPPQDGKIICSDRGSDKGTCYLITGGQKAGFTSAAVFTGLGFSFARSQMGDVSWMSSTTNIDNTTAAHRPGVLVNSNGTVYLMGSTGLLGIPDVSTFNGWGYSFSDVVMANASDKAMTQTGVMAARLPGQLSPTALTSTPVTPGNPVVTGSVTVSAASGQTPSSNIPKKATNVNFVKFTVANGSASAVTVNQVTVKRMGAGATSDISNVYLYQGASRLTSGRSVNSSTNEAVFSGLNVTVPAYGSVTLDVLADIANQGTGNTHQMSVTSVVMGSTMASGSATGNMMTIAGVSNGTLTIAKTGTIANPKVGETGVRVAAFTLNADSAEDQIVKRISLYQAGATARGNLVNLVLKQAGTTLATASSLDSKDKVNFEVNYALAKGDTKTFEVYADIAGGARTGSSETIKFYVEEASDLYAMGQTYGFGAAVTKTTYDGDSCTSSSGDCSYAYVDGGQLTITFNGPTSKDISKNSKDVEIFNFTMAAQNNLEVRQMQITIDNGGSGTADLVTGSNPNYTDVKIVDASSGAVVWGPQDLNGSGSDTTQTLTFTEDVVLSAGSSKTYKVTADVSNESDVTDGDKLGATLVVSGLTSNMVKNLDNNLFLSASDIVPTSSVAGNQMTLKTTGLTIALAATPVSKTVVKGTNGVEVAGYAFTASTAKDVKVTDITLTGYIEDNGNTTMAAGYDTDTNVSDDVVFVELYDGATKLGQTKSPAVTTGLVTFNNLNWTIPAGSTKTLTVKMNINSTATTNDDIKFGIASGNVTAVDNDGNTVSITGLPSNTSTSTTAGTVITVAGSGTMTVGSAGTSATDGTDARIVVAGQEVTMGKINFTANSEELQINKLRLTLESATGTAVSVTDDVMSVSLYNAAGTKIAGPVSITPTNDYEGYADINSITGLVIPKDETVTVTVKAMLNTISGGADSGDEFALAVDTSNNFEARGTAGSTYLTSIGSGSYTSQYMVLRKGQPKFELQTLPSTTINNGGTNTLMRFKVTADGSPVALKYLEFNVSTTTGVTVTSPAISEVGGSDISVSSDLTGTVVRLMLSSEETITTSKTYDFKMTITGADTGDSVTTSFATQDTAAVTGDLNGTTYAIAIDDADDASGAISATGDATAQDAAYNLVWSDKAATGHNDSNDGTDDWTNGRYIKTITGSQGVSK